MDTIQYLKTASNKKRAVVGFISKDKKVLFFPNSLIENEDCEVFLSVRRCENRDLIKLLIRCYSDKPDFEKLPFSLSYGAQKKKLPLGEACGVPVMSNRKREYVTRFCAKVPLPLLFEIIDEKELYLTDGVSSKKLKTSSNNSQITKLALFLASCFGLEQLTEEFKGIVIPLIEQEQELILQKERQVEEEKKQLEEARRQKKEKEQKEAEERRAAAERRKMEEEKAQQLLVKDTKELLSYMWDSYRRYRHCDNYRIDLINNTYCLYGYWSALFSYKTRTGDYYQLRHPRERILEMVKLLSREGIINSYKCKDNQRNWGDTTYIDIDTTYIDIDDIHFDTNGSISGFSIFKKSSLEQLYDVLDHKLSISEIKKNSPRFL